MFHAGFHTGKRQAHILPSGESSIRLARGILRRNARCERQDIAGSEDQNEDARPPVNEWVKYNRINGLLAHYFLCDFCASAVNFACVLMAESLIADGFYFI